MEIWNGQFQSLSPPLGVVRRLNELWWCFKTTSKFSLDRFLTFILVWHHVTYKLRCSTFGKRILPLRGVNRQSCTGVIISKIFVLYYVLQRFEMFCVFPCCCCYYLVNLSTVCHTCWLSGCRRCRRNQRRREWSPENSRSCLKAAWKTILRSVTSFHWDKIQFLMGNIKRSMSHFHAFFILGRTWLSSWQARLCIKHIPVLTWLWLKLFRLLRFVCDCRKPVSRYHRSFWAVFDLLYSMVTNNTFCLFFPISHSVLCLLHAVKVI